MTMAHRWNTMPACECTVYSRASLPLGLSALLLGESICLLTIEAEPFCEYALHLARASPFAVTLTIGYTDGCVGYLPTEAEFAHGGYEVVHSPHPYGQRQRLERTAERAVVRSALALLGTLRQRVAASSRIVAPAVPRPAPRAMLPAQALSTGFDLAHDTYNSLGVSPASAAPPRESMTPHPH